MAQDQTQVLLRDGCHGLLQCCRGLQNLIGDVFDLLPRQLGVDTTSKEMSEVLQPLQGVCLQQQGQAGSAVGQTAVRTAGQTRVLIRALEDLWIISML